MNNLPHIVYYNAEGKIIYAFYNGTSWKKETLPINLGNIYSFVLDRQNKPHILGNYTDYLVDYYYNGTDWRKDILINAWQKHIIGGSEMVKDSILGAFAIIYDNDLRKYYIKYFYNENGTWNIESVTSIPSEYFYKTCFVHEKYCSCDYENGCGCRQK
jgi:hypothetical protein